MSSNKQNNQEARKLKQERKWTHLIKTWGQSDEALANLAKEGDRTHGKGFSAFLKTNTSLRKLPILFEEKTEPQTQFSAIKPKLSFAEIMEEQEQEFAQRNTYYDFQVSR